MGRELQKRKNRSSNPKVTRRKNTRHTRIKSFGNEIIRQNWDPKQTLTQNYQRLGLSTRLNASGWCPIGGNATLPVSTKSDTLTQQATLTPGEARIIRDSDGNVLRIEHGPSADEALDTEPAEEVKEVDTRTEVVKLLESLQPAPKRERTQSDREREWVEGLVAKYGREYKKMERDRRLNPMQQTAADIRRRVEKWEKAQEK
ncbi:hypothetical protein EX30DRAFT_292446, partial [Ascodesmis nigricans]